MWRGDLSLAQSEFNEIDNLILARFSYFPFDHIIKPEETITIEEASKRFEKLDVSKEKILQNEDIEFFILLGKNERFANMQITNYVNKIIPEEEKQFSAITIIMPDDTIYISFRGTDNTLIGWKEDFNMSFQENVPSQLEAVQYTKNVAQNYKNLLRIGGHSKGGNLAVYAASFSNKEIQDRIINVYNNDGPGFQEKIIQSQNYQRILNKVHTFVPQTSIIGRLLYHEENYTVVQSTQNGVMQHDLYTWQLQGKQFIHLDEVDDGSRFIDKTIKDWLGKVSNEQRAEFINSVFEILQATDADTLAQIKEKWVKNAKILISTYKNMDEESKKMMVQTIEALFVIIKDNIVNKIKPQENK
jgi:hypothetical protein